LLAAAVYSVAATYTRRPSNGGRFFMLEILDSHTFSIFEFFENFVKFMNSAWIMKFEKFIEFFKFC
jgi:hypothetical protein